MKKIIILLLLPWVFSCSNENSFPFEEEIIEENDESLSRSYTLYWDISNTCELILQEPINEILSEIMNIPEYEYMYDLILINNTKINYIYIYQDNHNSVAAYEPKFKMMYFRDEYVVHDAFPEEFIHFIQDLAYDGIYGRSKADIEFEAKFFQDCLGLNDGIPLRGIGAQYGKLYMDWLLKIFDQFYVTARVYDTILEGISGLTYDDFLEDFATKNSSYGIPEHCGARLLEYLYN